MAKGFGGRGMAGMGGGMGRMPGFGRKKRFK